MSHGTSKRIRALFNHTACRRPVSMKAELTLLTAIGLAVLRRSATEFYFKMVKLGLRTWRRLRAFVGRVVDAIVGIDAYERLGVQLPGVSMQQKVVMHPDQVLEIPALPALPEPQGDEATDYLVTLMIGPPHGGVRKARVTLEPEGRPGFYLYTATSAASEYFIERYLLGLTVLGPTRRRDSDTPRPFTAA